MDHALMVSHSYDMITWFILMVICCLLWFHGLFFVSISVLKLYRHAEVQLYYTRLLDCGKETREVRNRPP